MSTNEATLFDLTPFERADTKDMTPREARKVKVKMKVTEYERRVPERKKKGSAGGKKRPPKKTIAERFAEFDEKNPHVKKMLIALALADKRAGMQRGGMQMYLEQVRYRMRRRTTTSEPFKVSNDFAAHYARCIMRDVPELEGFFELRELKSE